MPDFSVENIFNKMKIIGIDEVGRGCVAGPLVAASVLVDRSFLIFGVDDSKKLSPSKRDILYQKIIDNYQFSIGMVSSKEIDNTDIVAANKLAVTRSCKKNIEFDIALVDGIMEFDSDKYLSIVHGDSVSYSIASASIVAKVYRDRLMTDLSVKYPEYHFDKNKGYLTQQHIEAIKNHGLVDGVHRKSFLKDWI